MKAILYWVLMPPYVLFASLVVVAFVENAWYAIRYPFMRAHATRHAVTYLAYSAVALLMMYVLHTLLRG